MKFQMLPDDPDEFMFWLFILGISEIIILLMLGQR